MGKYKSNRWFWWKPHKEIIHMASILAYGFGLSSHMGSTFYKNVATCWSESAKKHEIWSESGPYGSVWGDTQAEWILQGLGSLWDASRTLKPPGKSKNPGFRGFKEIPLISPYYPGLGLWHRLTVAAAGWPKENIHTLFDWGGLFKLPSSRPPVRVERRVRAAAPLDPRTSSKKLDLISRHRAWEPDWAFARSFLLLFTNKVSWLLPKMV